MKLTKALVLCTLCLSAAVLAGNFENRCVPYFTNDMISFDLMQVSPSDPSNPLSGNSMDPQGDQYTFLPCAPLQQSKLPDQVSQLCASVQMDNNMMLVYNTQLQTCKATTSSKSSVEQTELTDSNGNTNGVQIRYIADKSDGSVDGRDVIFKFYCNKDIADSSSSWTPDFSANAYVMTTSCKSCCGYSLSDAFNFFNSNVYLFGGIFIGVGLIFAFFGRKWFTYTLVLAGFLIGFLFVVGLAYGTANLNGTDNKKKAVFFILGTMLGSLIAFVFYKFKKVTTMGALAVLFYLIGNAIIRFALAGKVHNQWVQWSIIIVLMLIGVGIGYVYSDHCIIFATAYGGAFLAVYSIGMLTKTLDSPSVIDAKIRAGEKNVIDCLPRLGCTFMAVDGLSSVLLHSSTSA
jgi:predicted membrane protein